MTKFPYVFIKAQTVLCCTCGLPRILLGCLNSIDYSSADVLQIK